MCCKSNKGPRYNKINGLIKIKNRFMNKNNKT